MNQNLTDITIVMDRSGSMSSCRQEAENGLNHFIKEQAKQPGDCLLTLVQFDTEYEFVCKGIPVKDAPHFELDPRGMTALLDAVGRAINETGKRLSDMKEEDRPGLVIFVILTDGYENSSHEFTKAQIRKMIEHQKSKYHWQFTFLGANQDAFAEAADMGICVTSAASFAPTVKGLGNTFDCISANVSMCRNVYQTSGCYVDIAYSDEDREKMLMT